MIKLETRADLKSLINDAIPESLTLEYKASPALAKDGKAPDELCKDASAFANSAGGQLIYGIEEKHHRPLRIDEGSDLPREWIEQVIGSRVQPRIDGVIITPISISAGRHAYILTIPQASSRAPHQAPDKKYYKRQNFQSVPMEDYEIRDTLRRATTPELHIDLSFESGLVAPVKFDFRKELSEPITVIVTVTNRSSQPAFHAVVQVGVDTDLRMLMHHEFYSLGGEAKDGKNWIGHRFSSPPSLPIFKELDPSSGHGQRYSLTVGYPSQLTGGERIFEIATVVQTPGYSATEKWIIHFRSLELRMCPPGHHLNP
jgi:hypothetical protein